MIIAKKGLQHSIMGFKSFTGSSNITYIKQSGCYLNVCYENVSLYLSISKYQLKQGNTNKKNASYKSFCKPSRYWQFFNIYCSCCMNEKNNSAYFKEQTRNYLFDSFLFEFLHNLLNYFFAL